MANIAVFNEIKEILDGNGNLDQATKDKLIMTALVCVWTELLTVKTEVEKRIHAGVTVWNAC